MRRSIKDTLRGLGRLGQAQRDATLERLQAMGLEASAAAAARMLGLEHDPNTLEFAPWQVEVLGAIQARICAYEELELPSTQAVGATDASVAFARTMPSHLRAQLRDVIVLLEAGVIVLGPRRRARRFSALKPAEQDDYLRGWEQSALVPQRAAFFGIKSLCMMGYWTRPQVWPHIDYTLDTEPT